MQFTLFALIHEILSFTFVGGGLRFSEVVLLDPNFVKSFCETLGLENFLIFIFKGLVFAVVSFFLFSFFHLTHVFLVRSIFCILQFLPKIVFVLILICFYFLCDGSLQKKEEAYQRRYRLTQNYCIHLEEILMTIHLFILTNYPD